MKKAMTLYHEWDHDSKRLEIHSEQELDSIGDRLTNSAIQESMPMSIELYARPETCLSIGIGRISIDGASCSRVTADRKHDWAPHAMVGARACEERGQPAQRVQ